MPDRHILWCNKVFDPSLIVSVIYGKYEELLNMGKSEVGAVDIEIQEQTETQMFHVDIYIKVYFSILVQSNEQEVDTIENKVAEELVLKDVVGEYKNIDIEDKMHETFIIDCSDLIVDDDGVCRDAIGMLSKIDEAADCVFAFIESRRRTIPLAMVHFAIYGFEIIEDVAWGFAFLVDECAGLNLADNELNAYIQQSPCLFGEDVAMGWEGFIEYMGIFEYYQIFQPIECSIEKNVYVQSIPHDSVEQEMSLNNESEGKTTVLCGRIEENHYVEAENTGWLDNTQFVLAAVGLMPIPVVSEVSSLINGFVYLGREVHAVMVGDFDSMEKYKKEAIESFVGAVPATSLLKGAIKVAKIAKARSAVKSAESLVAAAGKNKKNAKAALNRARNKGRRRALGKAKDANRNAAAKLKLEKENLRKAENINEKRVNEARLTMEEASELSKNILSNPDKWYKVLMKSSDNALMGPSNTWEDWVIDAYDYINKLIDANKLANDRLKNSR